MGEGRGANWNVKGFLLGWRGLPIRGVSFSVVYIGAERTACWRDPLMWYLYIGVGRGAYSSMEGCF